MAWWTPLTGGITSLAKSWIESRDLKRTHKHELAKIKATAEVEHAKSLAHVEATYDNLAQTAMKTSWKDEYLTIVFTVPFIITFLAPFVDAYLKLRDINVSVLQLVTDAWAAVSSAPEWYQYMLGGIVVATFGLRWLLRTKLNKVLNNVKE